MILNFSQHAENRSAQRNIPNHIISRALTEGIWRKAPGDAWLINQRDIIVVVSLEGVIITVYKTRMNH